MSYFRGHQATQGHMQKLRLASFLLNFAECERMIEVTRQVLTCLKGFEPYSAFQRIVQIDNQPMAITPNSLDSFMRDMTAPIDHSSAETLIFIYSSKLAGFLDFEDFLRLVLSREATAARFEAARREVPADIDQPPEVDYLLTRLISRLCDFFRKIKTDSEVQTLLSESSSLFGLLANRNLDFNSLQNFFKSLNMVVNEKDVLAILRLIDINDDGIIDKAEFEYFLSLINVRQQNREALSQKVLAKTRSEKGEISELKTSNRRENIRNTLDSRTRSSVRPEVSQTEKSGSSIAGGVGYYERTRRTETRIENKTESRTELQRKTSPSRSKSPSITRPNRTRRDLLSTGKVEDKEKGNYGRVGESREKTQNRIINPTIKQNEISEPQTQTYNSDFKSFTALRPLNKTVDKDTVKPEIKTTETYTYKRTVIDDRPADIRNLTPTKRSANIGEEKRGYRANRTEFDKSASKISSGVQEDHKNFGATTDSFRLTQGPNMFRNSRLAD